MVVDQYIDRTFARDKSFFGQGLVAHVSMAHPVCERLSAMTAQAARTIGPRVTEGGTYLCMEGPQFSTQAESELYRSWGCSVIGMTNMPEAKLAREAELPYASIAMVTDYDCWHGDHAHVEVTDIVKVMHANAEAAKATVAELCRRLAATPRTPSPIDTGLDTRPDHAPRTPRPGRAGQARRGGGTGAQALNIGHPRGRLLAVGLFRPERVPWNCILWGCFTSSDTPRGGWSSRWTHSRDTRFKV